jgi:hypothetical protein
MIWQVSWQKKYYDYRRLIDDVKNGRHHGFIKQSKGMAKYRVLPQIGDDVYISCNKLRIMKCKVVSEFVVNPQEMRDDYCIGIPGSNEHRCNNTFLMMQIVEIYDEPERLLGVQRTWKMLI